MCNVSILCDAEYTMPSFWANPNPGEDEPWIEREAFAGYGFRIWHIMFFCSSALVAILILLCCCIKFRIPRTKQEIENNYRRKQLTAKFRERLKLIRNYDMSTMELEEALRIIQEDYETEKQKIVDVSVQVSPDFPRSHPGSFEFVSPPLSPQPCTSGYRMHRSASLVLLAQLMDDQLMDDQSDSLF